VTAGGGIGPFEKYGVDALMDLEHFIALPVSRERAWDALLDGERTARCLPGIALKSIGGGQMQASIKVKVGPIRLTYAGTARLVEQDVASGVMLLKAFGEETRGAGTASATVRLTLEDRGGETLIAVHTTLDITGKPAKFGKGVVNEIWGKLAENSAANLTEMIIAGQVGQALQPASSPQAQATPGQADRDQGQIVHVGALDPGAGHRGTSPHADEATAALREIVAEYGPDALSNPAAMSNLLADLLPESPKISRILITAAEDHIADRLREHAAQGMDPLTASRLVASAFAESTSFTPEACARAVGTIAAALGLTGRAPTVVVQPPPAP
jgi:uncharacterized protein